MPDHAGRRRVIFNPAADRGRTARRVTELRETGNDFPEIDWQPTGYPGHATELARTAGEAGYKQVIAVGGDGTVHEVVNGLMALPASSRPQVGVVPCGSGNDFAWCAGLDARPVHALRNALTGRTCPVDVGRVHHARHGDRHFANSAGLFIVAAISIRAREVRGLYGLPMYLLATVRSIIADYAPVQVSVRADGATHEQAVIMLSVGNGPREGGGFLTNPEARHDDGLLDYMLSRHIPRWRMLRLLPAVMGGRQASQDCVTMGRTATLTLEADAAIPVHLDGEIWATTDDNLRALDFSIDPAALVLIK